MSFNNVIRSDDAQAVVKLRENIESIESRQEFMQTVNDYYKEHGTVEGCPGVELEMAVELDSRVRDGQNKPYPGQFFTDNKKEIQRMTGVVERLQNQPETVFQSWKFFGGEAVVNLANNRLQLMFNEKPSDEIISSLKKNGFHWARTQGAWQRPLTHQTMSVADKLDFIKPLDGRKPTDLQPKAPKKNEPER